MYSDYCNVVLLHCVVVSLCAQLSSSISNRILEINVFVKRKFVLLNIIKFFF